MCLGGLLTFLRSNFRFGGRDRDSGWQWEWEIRRRTGCCEVGGVVGFWGVGGGEAIVLCSSFSGWEAGWLCGMVSSA
jgi:hypothetical protein